MNVEDHPHSQVFFDSHNDDVISMAWSQDRTEMFTGEMGAKPTIFRWDKEGNELKRYKGVKKGVSAVAVNQNYLVASGLDDNHYIYVFDIEKGSLVASEKGGREVILGLAWVSGSSFASVGPKHFKSWEFAGGKVKGKTGSFGKHCNLLCSVEVKEGKVFTGASNGEVLVWGGNSVAKAEKGHSGAVNALCIHEDILLSGSNDESIKIWNADSLKLLFTVDVKFRLEGSVSKKIRALDVMDKRILVGTFGSEIYQLESSLPIKDTTADVKVRVFSKNMSGHYSPNYVTNEVWGLGFID